MSERIAINVPAFIFALILAPATIGALAMAIGWGLQALFPENASILVFGIATAASIFGLPTYLTFGTAFFIYYLRRTEDSFISAMAWAGLRANFASTPLVFLFFLMVNDQSAVGGVAFYVGFGTIFAPLWGANFGWLYSKMRGIGGFLNANRSGSV